MKWATVAPELYFTIMAGVFFALALRKRVSSGRDYAVALVMSAAGIGVAILSAGMQGSLFFDAYRVDLFSQAFKVLIATGLFLVVWLCVEMDLPRGQHPEFYFLLVTCSLGMMFIVSSVELLTLYVSLELTSYSLYVLVPMRRAEDRGQRTEDGEGSEVRGQRSEFGKESEAAGGEGFQGEAGIKYFLIGATVSTIMLFGLALLFGATRTTYLAGLVHSLPEAIGTPMGFVGLLFTLSGFFFKLAFFPFHVWGPTVYQAASNQTTAFIATTTKVMAIAVVTRIIAASGGSGHLAEVLLVLAVVSMSLGNLAALVQRDMKRLLAYSAIAHAGYVLIGILSMTQKGYAAALFYAVAYMAMTFICFMVVLKVSTGGRNLEVAELAGLHHRSPLLAMALMVGIFSLGGIPPTIGFTGKFLVFTAAMEKGHFVLVLIAMANVAVSLYYYIQIIRAAYLLEPGGEVSAISLSLFGRSLTVALVIFVFLGGLFPGYLYEIAARAAGVLP
ncbi:MAG: NADH-quinone oxidoreductase subunit N [Deltaproteobacteria bacterium HGW-Deltaproteobacteria-15]|jgi:NADH-quinone oxidoreductase subunit N|nr:MAG: NADH-quinone oxidoreductase subunit N [Deltaproteobacteria bacterium HGW-Deltaproteobacteria-15]